MQQVPKNNHFTLRDVLQYILNLEVKTAISGFILFVATFSSCNLFLNRIDLPTYNSNTHEVKENNTLIYWAYGKNTNSGYLKHVYAVLDRLGYIHDINASEWDLLWAHDYPFRKLYTQLFHLKPNQKVNHFPGCGYLTNKVDLSTSGLKYIPPAFKLPNQKDEFLSYSKTNSNKIFITKSNEHRGIKIQKIKEIDLNSEGIFLQEYVDKPYLVDGYKFDIGVYTIITSIDPLRIYIYNGDVLFRYCPVKYYPFDPENLDKYVVGDDYLPTWEVPSLKYYYNELGFSMKDSFNAYVSSRGQDPLLMWNKIEDAIRHVILNKEESIANVMQRFKSKRNFFEMMRFDFVLDENLEVYLMEANMSPNLSSAHYPPNRLLYEQVLYNLFSLIGLANRVRNRNSKSIEEQLMLTADKNIVVFPTECSSSMCKESCMSPICQVCKPCLSSDTKSYLIQAYQEHMNRQDCKRIFPPLLDQKSVNSTMNLEMYSSENQLLFRWFIGKCLLDASWC